MTDERLAEAALRAVIPKLRSEADTMHPGTVEQWTPGPPPVAQVRMDGSRGAAAAIPVAAPASLVAGEHVLVGFDGRGGAYVAGSAAPNSGLVATTDSPYGWFLTSGKSVAVLEGTFETISVPWLTMLSNGVALDGDGEIAVGVSGMYQVDFGFVLDALVTTTGQVEVAFGGIGTAIVGLNIGEQGTFNNWNASKLVFLRTPDAAQCTITLSNNTDEDIEFFGLDLRIVLEAAVPELDGLELPD